MFLMVRSIQQSLVPEALFAEDPYLKLGCYAEDVLMGVYKLVNRCQAKWDIVSRDNISDLLSRLSAAGFQVLTHVFHLPSTPQACTVLTYAAQKCMTSANCSCGCSCGDAILLSTFSWIIEHSYPDSLHDDSCLGHTYFTQLAAQGYSSEVISREFNPLKAVYLKGFTNTFNTLVRRYGFDFGSITLHELLSNDRNLPDNTEVLFSLLSMLREGKGVLINMEINFPSSMYYIANKMDQFHTLDTYIKLLTKLFHAGADQCVKGPNGLIPLNILLQLESNLKELEPNCKIMLRDLIESMHTALGIQKRLAIAMSRHTRLGNVAGIRCLDDDVIQRYVLSHDGVLDL